MTLGDGDIDRGVARARNLRLSRAGPRAQDPVSAEVHARHLEFLSGVVLPRGLTLDLGCGASPPLPPPFAGDGCVRADWVGWGAGTDVVCDAASLPFRDGAFSFVWSNMCAPWLARADQALAECRRVLGDGGLASFTSLGPGTLAGLRRSLVGPAARTLGFIDMHDLADMAMRAGFAEPVAMCESLKFEYEDHRAMLLELSGFGVLATPDMSRSLGGHSDLRRLMAAPGPAVMELEVVYVHAWAVRPRRPKVADGWREIAFS